MSKLNYENKLNLYNDRKNGFSLNELIAKYNVKVVKIKYLIKIIDKHGFDILKTTKNKCYSVVEIERIINRVLLDNESLWFVSVDEELAN